MSPVAQKPLSVSQLKRNPFKKTPQSAGKVANNPLRHLTENALGFDAVENGDESAAVSGVSREKENTSVANGSSTPKSRPTFIEWYKEHREELQKECPDLTPAELTKHSMGKYRTIYASNCDTPSSAKRKITADGANGTPSGIAKLAKFNFTKS